MIVRRNSWIDAAKAWGILLVVIGHNPYVETYQEPLRNIIYSFHIPLFFAISGATICADDTWKKVSIRSLSLLWVYLASAIFALPIELLMRSDYGQDGILRIVEGILYGTGQTMHPVPLWFLPCLAVVLPLSWLILRAAKWLACRGLSKSLTNGAIVMTSVALSTINGFYFSIYPRTMSESLNWGSFETSGALWSIDVSFLGTGFVLLGWLLSQEPENKPPIWTIHLAIFLFGALYWLFDPVLDLNSRIMRPVIGGVLVGVSGVIATFLCLRRLDIAPRWIYLIGTATLPVLVMHQLVQKKVFLYLTGINGEIGVLAATISIILAVGLPTAMDRTIFRNTLIGRIVFYPRTLLSGNYVASTR
jgi:fucose 4-O-acetylase-like acetyltransferase